MMGRREMGSWLGLTLFFVRVDRIVLDVGSPSRKVLGLHTGRCGGEFLHSAQWSWCGSRACMLCKGVDLLDNDKDMMRGS